MRANTKARTTFIQEEMAMSNANDRAENAGSHVTEPRSRAWVPAACASLALGVVLAVLVTVAFYSFVTTTPLALRIKWWQAVIIVEISAIAVAAVSYWSIRRRRVWFACLLPIVAWMVLTLFLIQSFTPFDSYQRFILDCATITRQQTIDEFEARMIERGWRRHDARNETEGAQSPAVFGAGGAEAFVVDFDPQTRQIEHWRFSHD